MGAVVIVLIIISVLSFQSINQLTENQRLQVYTNKVVKTLNKTLSAMQDAETGQRGFVITGKKSYLEPYDIGVRESAKMIAELYELNDASNSILHVSRIDSLKTLITLKKAELDKTIFLKKKGDVEEVMNIIVEGLGKRVMDDIREVIFRMEMQKKEGMTESNERMKQSISLTKKYILWGGLFSSLTVFVLIIISRIDLIKKKRLQIDLLKTKNDAENLVKESKRLLIANEHQLNLIYNNTIDSIWLINIEVTSEKINFRFISINEPFIFVTGLSRQNVEGNLLEEVLPPASHELVRSKYTEVYNNGETIHYFEIAHLPSGERHGEIRVVPIKDSTGRVVQLLGIAHDITESNIAKEKVKKSLSEKVVLLRELKESEKRLNMAQTITRIGSWEYDVESFRSTWSRELYSIFELKKVPPEKLFDEYRKKIHPDDLPELDRLSKKALESGLGYTYPHRIISNDGSIKEVIRIANPVVDANGKTIAIHGTCQDISSQVKLQRLKAVGEMSSSIAHDFNNSLQQMVGNLEIIKLQKDMPDKALIGLKNIGSIINDVADRVSALQKFGDTEHVNKNTQSIDFNALIEESLSQSRPLWKDGVEKEGLKISIVTDFGEIPKINCNSGDLKLAVYNLIKNSVEAMPDGGDIIIKTGIKPEGVFATFTDTGVGMDEETKSKIFQPFFSTKGFKLGRGLGMSGVFSTVRKYNGIVAVKSSELDKGTTIEMVFPIGDYNETKVVRENESKAKKSFSVLWVDDDAIITDGVCELVELMGHKCTIANSGKNALKHLNKNTYDIVFTDIGMPEMNGWELIEAIRKDFGNTIKIVTVTGWNIDEKAKEKHTIDFVLQKPFSLEKLENILLQI